MWYNKGEVKEGDHKMETDLAYVRDTLFDILSRLCAKEKRCEDCIFWNAETGEKGCEENILNNLSLEELADRVNEMALSVL